MQSLHRIGSVVIVVMGLLATSCSTGLLGGGSSVTITRDDSGWSVDPSPAIHSDVGLDIVIRNDGTEPFKPVLLFVIGFDTETLPRIDTELCRNGADLVFEPGVREIRCIEPQVPEEGAPFIVPDLDPGGSVSETDHSGVGSYVVLNYVDGAYDNGDFTVFDVINDPN